MKKYILILITILTALDGAAQDPLFTQTFHSPLYTNPAMCGTARADWRIAGVSRLQWVRVPSLFRYTSFSAERQFKNIGLSFAALFNRSNEGYLRNNGLFGIVGKDVNFNEDTYLNFAVQSGIGWRTLNLGDYLFADQINRDGIIPGVGSGMEAQPSGGNSYLDITPGFVFTWKSLMIGGAVHHIFNTDQGIFGDRNNLLKSRHSGHLNLLLQANPNDDESVRIKPAVYVNFQGRSTRLQAGGQIEIPTWGVEVSAWYQNNTGFAQANSFSLGINLKLARSRDPYNSASGHSGQFGVSGDRELTNGLPNRTFGSFELGGIYEYSKEECPKPYNGKDLKKYPWAFL